MPTEDDLRIGQLAVDRGWIKPPQLDRAMADLTDRERRGLGTTLGRVLYEKKWIDADQLIWLVRSVNEARVPEVEPEPPPKPAGRRDLLFGKFEIVGELARGAMGIVYKARQAGLERIIAVKVMREGEEATQEQVVRFHREAELASKLRHPNIVPIHDVGVYEGKHYFTMDFIEGETLEGRLKRGRMRHEEAASLLEKVARAIHFAHTKGVVHRDLKPSNLLLDERGEPQVTDFGLARRMDVKSVLTQSGAALGTPFYMAPEQICGDNARIDGRSDVFALGVILYEMLAGRRPFSGNSAVEIFQQVTQEEPPPLTRVDSSIHRDLETICEKCLEKLLENRYASALEMAEDLARYLRGEPVMAKPVSWTDRTVRRIRRHRMVAGFAALSAALALAAAGVVWWQHVSSEEDAASHAREIEGERERSAASRRERERLDRERAEAERQAHDSEYRSAILAAQMLAKERKWDEAAARLDAAIKLDGGRAEAYGERGRVLRARKKPREAIAAFDEAAKRAPREGDWLFERGCAWHELGEAAKAEEDLTQAIDLGPAPAAYHIERGIVRVERGDDAEAIKDFTWAIHREEGKYEPWKRRGQCHLRLKEWTKAEEDFTGGLSAYSQSAECLSGRAQARMELGKFVDAVKDCDRYVKQKPADAQGYLLRGRVLLAGVDPEPALADFDKALSLDASLADAGWGRAQALDALGRAEDARAAWEAFLAKWPADPRAAEARKRLE